MTSDSSLKITLIQTDLHWQDIDANLAMFEEKIWQINQHTDLIILPEMFNTGFSMDTRKLAEPMNSKTFRWMKQQAAQTGAVVTGSVIIRADNQYYNRLIWMEPSGEFAIYDKRHLFRMGQEHLTFTPGNQRIICSLKGWRICPLVCYDLRFPAWSRNQFDLEKERLQYDLLMYVANWPEPRSRVWDTLLPARALENLCYVVGVNRIGKDGENVRYNGHSKVIDFKGNSLMENREDEFISSISINMEALQDFRKKFPVYLDSDHFEIH